jgi:hypothetical protein
MGLCVTLTNLEAKRILLRYSFFPGVIDVEHRLLELVGKFQSQLGSAAEYALKTENQSAIAFLDVSPSAQCRGSEHGHVLR